MREVLGMIVRLWAFSLCVIACLDAGSALVAEHDRSRHGFHVEAFHKTADPAVGSWDLSLDDHGQMVVSIGKTRHELHVSEKKQDELLRVIQHEGFFELDDELGGGFVGGPIRQMEVVLGGQRKQVVLLSGLSQEKDLEHVKRALRVWSAIRGLFDLPEAADSRDEDRRILEE